MICIMRFIWLILACLWNAAAIAGPTEDLIAGAARQNYPSFADPDDRVEVHLGSVVRGDIREVLALRLDPRTGRFRAVLSDGRHRLRVFGRVDALQPVPVPRRDIAPGEPLSAADLETRWIKKGETRGVIIRDMRDLVGQQALRDLAAGRPVAERAVGAPRLVSRNSLVAMVFKDGPLQIRGRGRALEDGAKGEVIRVANIKTGAILMGRVVGPDQTELSF